MEFIFSHYLIPALIVYGGSLLLSQSTIFDPVRRFLATRYTTNFFCKWGWLLITCQICTSFWIGMLLGTAFPAYSLTGVFILDGVLSCTFTTFLSLFAKKLDYTPEPVQGGCSGCGKNKNTQE